MGLVSLEVNFEVVKLIASTRIEDEDDNIAWVWVTECSICGYDWGVGIRILNFAVFINIVVTSVFSALRTRLLGCKIISESVMKFV